MGKGIEEARLDVINWFPGLCYDCDFKITSPEDPNYNCIAWAYHINNRWMWPTGYVLDGVTYWPNDNASNDVECFVNAFRLKGYEKCETSDFENGYRKIALYIRPGTSECTHAARQLSSGLWTSKLGELYDIQHGTPQTIEGSCYGTVYCYMRRKHE